MQQIPQDYQAAQGGDFDKVADGAYIVEDLDLNKKSINDSSKQPMLISTDYGNVAYVNLTSFQNGTEEGLQIPVSLSLAEFPFLVKSFGGNIDQLTAIPEETDLAGVSSYITNCIQLIKAGANRPSIRVKNGWGSVGRMSNTTLPAGVWHFQVVDLPYKTNGLPSTKQDNYGGLQFAIVMRVVADQYGKVSPFSGCRVFWPFINYRVETYHDEAKGKTLPRFTTNSDGIYTEAAKKFANLLQSTGPSMFQKAPEDYPNPENILPDYLAAAIQDKKLISLNVTIDEAKGFNKYDIGTVQAADWNNVQVAVPNGQNNQPVMQATAPPVIEQEVAVATTNGVDHLVHLGVILNILSGSDELFPIDGVFPAKWSEAQKTILRKFISPHKAHFSTVKLAKFTVEDVIKLVGFIDTTSLSEVGQIQLSQIGDSLEDMTTEESDI